MMTESCIDCIEKSAVAELNTRLERWAINSPPAVRREKDMIVYPRSG